MPAHRFTAIVWALLISGASARLVAQQSLADLARQEEERRKSVPAPAKVYTNKDLGGALPAAASPTPAPPPANDTKDTKDTKDTRGAKDAKDAKDAKGPAEATKDPKDRAYWGGRLKALQDQLARDQTYSDALQTRINSLTTDFVNRADPAQRSVIERDRQKAIAELDHLKKSVIDDQKAIADFQEEARRAGIPPGWMR